MTPLRATLARMMMVLALDAPDGSAVCVTGSGSRVRDRSLSRPIVSLRPRRRRREQYLLPRRLLLRRLLPRLGGLVIPSFLRRP